jgi:hypothetical protein
LVPLNKSLNAMKEFLGSQGYRIVGMQLQEPFINVYNACSPRFAAASTNAPASVVLAVPGIPVIIVVEPRKNPP